MAAFSTARSRAFVAGVDEPVVEGALFAEFYRESHVAGQRPQSPTYDQRHGEELEHVDESGSDRGGGRGGTEDRNVTVGACGDVSNVIEGETGYEPVAAGAELFARHGGGCDHFGDVAPTSRQRRANSCSASVPSGSSYVYQYCMRV